MDKLPFIYFLSLALNVARLFDHERHGNNVDRSAPGVIASDIKTATNLRAKRVS
jgi:hypothetical protein